MTPDLSPALVVASALAKGQIPFALGGSGLLYSLGLVEQVRDWDFTTDAPLPDVAQALRDLQWHPSVHGDPPFASAYRLSVVTAGPPVDLMGRFAIETDAGICQIPTVPAFAWNGLPMGSPEVWAVAYRLMRRHQKADLLSAYVRNHGGKAVVVEQLLQQPLPADVRLEVRSWHQP